MSASPSYGSALAVLYSRHQSWLLQRLRARLRNHSDAEDLAAETFCQLLASRVDPSGLIEPRAYLSTLAKRLTYHFHRRRKLEQAWLERMACKPEETSISAEEQAMLLETIIRIDRALSGLPLAVRKAFLYSVLDDLGYEDIAQRLGISVRTVGRYMKQALRHCWLAQDVGD